MNFSLPHRENSSETDVLVPVIVQDLSNHRQARRFANLMSEVIEKAQSEGRDRLTLDFQEVTRVGSAGLNELIAVNSHARCDGLRVVLVNVQESVREIFSLTRMERMFDFEGPAS